MARPPKSGETQQRTVRLPRELWARLEAFADDLQGKLPVRVSTADVMRLLLDAGLAARGFGERTEGAALVARIVRRVGPGPVELLDREGALWWVDLAGYPQATDPGEQAPSSAALAGAKRSTPRRGGG